jgi:hypothetical protein
VSGAAAAAAAAQQAEKGQHMTPESAEQFNQFLEALFKGPAGPIIGFGLVIVIFLICSALEKK